MTRGGGGVLPLYITVLVRLCADMQSTFGDYLLVITMISISFKC